MWFLPSRGRPDNIKRFFEAYRDTEATTPGVLWLDDDDSHNYHDIEFPEGWDRLVMPRMGGTGKMTNKFYELYPNEPWYGLIGDDVLPRTKHWDKLLVEAAGLDGLAYANDLLRGEAHAAHPVVGGRLVRKLGWLALPGCDRTYIDDALMFAAKKEGKCKYVPEVVLEHLHFSVGKSEFDDTYQKSHGDNDRRIFEAWVASFQKPVTFVCVSWGNYCGKGAEYVNVLYDSVCRNLQAGFPGRFICFTDDTEGLNKQIETRSLPEGITGWWNKLYLFKEGLFEEGERIIFLDLDTIIVAELDDIVRYDGEFATLRDFYNPERVGPAIMMWRAGALTNIWQSYKDAEFPTDLPLGDLSWINKVFHETGYKPEILQDLFPEKICSYKRDAKFTVPKKASIVCFHGEPRPHEAGGWVENVWKVGGSTKGLGNFHCNVDDEKLTNNILQNISRYPNNILKDLSEPTNDVAILVGGGPSLLDNNESDINLIRAMQQNGAHVFGLNNTAKYLRSLNCRVKGLVLVDAREENCQFIDQDIAENYYVSSWVSSKILDKIEEYAFDSAQNLNPSLKPEDWQDPSLITIFNIAADVVFNNTKGGLYIGGGRTVGLIALALLKVLGYRTIHIFGYDSSYKDGKHHAYQQRLNDGDQIIEVEYAGRSFTTTPWMAKQAEDFIDLSRALVEQGVALIIHGDGLLPHIAKSLENNMEESYGNE